MLSILLPQHTVLSIIITTSHYTVHKNYHITLYCPSELPHHTVLSIRITTSHCTVHLITTAHCTVHQNDHSTLYCPSELPHHTILSIRITTAHCTVHQNYHSTLRVPPLLPPKTVTRCCLLLHCLNPCTLAMPLGSTLCLSNGLILCHCCFGTVLSTLGVLLLPGWTEVSSSETVWRETSENRETF